MKSITENGAQVQALTTSVEELAQSYSFKRVGNEWHGANPTGNGATTDGYILNDDGSSFDRKLDRRFSSIETAQNFSIPPEEFEPVAWYRAQNGKAAPAYNRTAPRDGSTPKPKPKPIAIKTFDYLKDGALLFQTMRREYSDGSKDFTQRRPGGGDEWVYSLKDIAPVLYHHDELKAADAVIICEGEKAADAINEKLRERGLHGETIATTNPMGADKWRDYYSEELAGKHVAILPDNDEPGHRHAAKIMQSLTGKAASIKVVELPDLPEKGDVVEYFANGNGLAELLAAIDETPEKLAPKVRFALVSILELLQRPDPTWLIHGVLQSHTNSCLSAAHASFKSFLALDMALCVATGRQWCGRDVMQGDVVYVCAEGASGMKARVLAWCHDKGIDPPANFHFIDDAVQIHDPKQRGEFFAALGVLKPALIIFDTLSLCALGLEENASKDMNLFMDCVKRVQDETGAHVLLVHHHSKAGGARGSSAIPAAVQSEFELKRERDTATLTCTKQKDGLEFKPMTFTSRLVEFDTWRHKSSLVLDFNGNADAVENLTATEQKVYSILIETFGAAGTSLSEWKSIATDENKIPKQSFYRSVTNLISKGQVHDGGGKRGAILRPVELMESESLKVSNSLNETEETEAKQESLKVSPPFRGETNETDTFELKKARKSKNKKSGGETL